MPLTVRKEQQLLVDAANKAAGPGRKVVRASGEGFDILLPDAIKNALNALTDGTDFDYRHPTVIKDAKGRYLLSYGDAGATNETGDDDVVEADYDGEE